MQSRISYFSKYLYLKTFLRFWPLWGFASFIAAIVPFSFLINARVRMDGFSTADPLYEMQNVASTAIPLLTFFYAILCAMAVWNYLYSAKSVGMFHSLPVKREGLYITYALSGMSMMVAPYLIACFFQIIVELLTGYFSLESIALAGGVGIAESLLFFGIATFLAQLSGNIVALPALYLFFNFIEWFLKFLLSTFIEGFTYGLEYSYLVEADWLSPLPYILSNVGTQDHYREGELISHEFANVYIVWVYALVGLVLMALGLLIYKRRKSESAGDVIAFKSVYSVILVLLVTAFTGGLGSYLYEIYNINGCLYYEVIPMLICLLVSCTIGLILVKIVLNKTVRVFNKKLLIELGISFGIIILFVAALGFDIFGIEKKVPATEDFTRMTFSADFTGGNAINLEKGKDDKLIETVMNLHKATIENKDHYRDIMDSEDRYLAWSHFSVTYYKGNDVVVERCYQVPLIEETFGDGNEIGAGLKLLANSEPSTMVRYGLVNNAYYVDGEVSSYTGAYEHFSIKQGDEIVAALLRDVQAGNTEDYPFLEANASERYVIFVTLETANEQGEKMFAYIQVTSSMKNTIDALMSIDAISEKDLVFENDYFEDEGEKVTY